MAESPTFQPERFSDTLSKLKAAGLSNQNFRDINDFIVLEADSRNKQMLNLAVDAIKTIHGSADDSLAADLKNTAVFAGDSIMEIVRKMETESRSEDQNNYLSWMRTLSGALYGLRGIQTTADIKEEVKFIVNDYFKGVLEV